VDVRLASEEIVVAVAHISGLEGMRDADTRIALMMVIHIQAVYHNVDSLTGKSHEPARRTISYQFEEIQKK